MKKYVILEGIEHSNRFYTTNHENPTQLADGTVAYKVIGYADTDKEAQAILYPTKEDELNGIYDCLRNSCKCTEEEAEKLLKYFM